MMESKAEERAELVLVFPKQRVKAIFTPPLTPPLQHEIREAVVQVARQSKAVHELVRALLAQADKHGRSLSIEAINEP